MTGEAKKSQNKKPSQSLADVRTGDRVRVYQRIIEKDKEKTQPFEGIVLAKKHGKGVSSTVTVRAIRSGIGVERIFPVLSPNVTKVEIISRPKKVRRSKLYYLRKKTEKEIRRKLR